jgi:Tol biopolymer transport system component
MRRLTTLAGFCGVLVALALPAGGGATVPGPNGLIVFRADEANGGQVYTIRTDGTDQRQLTHLAGFTYLPHWSPESSRIVFEYDPPTACANVATMNRNGGGARMLPLANGDVCEGSPTFSADGHRIYYEGFDGVSRDAIFSMALNGNDRHFVSDCEGTGVTDPEVSPDGTMISFTCYSAEGEGALFDANIDGSGLHQLTAYSDEVGNKSDWSPDSQRIMFIPRPTTRSTPGRSRATAATEPRSRTTRPAAPARSATPTRRTGSGSCCGSRKATSPPSSRSIPTAVA